MQELMQGLMAPVPAPIPSGVVLSSAPSNIPPPPPAPSSSPSSGAADGQPPSWMLESPQHPLPTSRVGASPTRGSGWNTFLFFGLIIFAVAAAGILGVVFWGPDKTVASRQHLASDPPPAEASSASPVSSASSVASAAASASSDAPAPADSAGPSKKGKKAKGKKVR